MVQSSNNVQGSVVSVGTWHRPNMQNKQRQTGKAVFWLSVFYPDGSRRAAAVNHIYLTEYEHKGLVFRGGSQN